MESKNKELNLGLQFLFVVGLWLVWLSTAVLVVWRELTLSGFYEDRLYVYSLVFVAIPGVFVGFGVRLMWRVGKVADLGGWHRVLFFVVGLLVCVEAMLVLLYCSAWCLGALDQVRE